MRLLPLRRPPGDPTASERPKGPLRRALDWITANPMGEAAAVLPQYTRSPPRYLGLLLLLILAGACYAYGLGFGYMAPQRIVQFGMPLLVLMALTIWALPDLGGAPTKAIERLFFAFFLSLPLWPNYLAIVLPGLPWITMMRLIGFPLVFLLALSLSISQSFRREISGPLVANPLLWRFLAAFAVIQCLSVGLSNSPQVSLQQLLVVQVNWTAMFFIAAFVFSRPGRIELWAALLIVAAVILTLIGLREFQLQKVVWAGHIPSFLAVQDEAVQRILSGNFRAGTTRYRIQATYATALGLGEFLAIVTPFILHFVGGAYHFMIRMVSFLVLPMLLVGIYLTDTRLGMVGFLLSCALYVFLWGALRWRQQPRSMVGPAVVLSYPAMFLAFIGAILVVPRLRLMTLGGGQHAASTDARVTQISEGIPLVFTHPLGFGIARGAEGLGYTNPGGVMTIDTYWLLTALDYGILGFILFYGMFVIAVISGFRVIISGTKDRELAMLVPLTISLIVYFIIKSIYAGVENQPTVYMMLGAVAALVYRARRDERGAPPRAGLPSPDKGMGAKTAR